MNGLFVALSFIPGATPLPAVAVPVAPVQNSDYPKPRRVEPGSLQLPLGPSPWSPA